MNSRANKPDTPADKTLQDCLSDIPPRSFIMKAGAGSGKTTSLIKALSRVVDIHGRSLRTARRKVACITYTEIAAEEIWRDVGNNPLIYVSTIHSFMWLLARPFQSDIRSWVSTRLQEKITKSVDEQAKYGPRVQQRTKDKAARDLAYYRRQLNQINSVNAFRYGTGSDYAKGVLGHDDIIKLGTFLLSERPLFRMLVAQQFPFIFVDESQDTSPDVVSALKAIEADSQCAICLGFFGDPMQRIYATGAGAIEPEPGWIEIPKPENYRCSRRVLEVANAIRRDGDDLAQTVGERLGPDGPVPAPEGTAKLFILPADVNRDINLQRVRVAMATHTGEVRWSDNNDASPHVRFLVIVHRMAAKRLGFGDLYSALNDQAPEAFKNGFLDASAWPLRPFMSFVLPLVKASASGNHLDVMQLLRRYSPLLDRDVLKGADVARELKKLDSLVSAITDAFADDSDVTVKTILETIHKSGLYVLDTRLAAYLEHPQAIGEVSSAAGEETDIADDDDLSKEIAAVESFLLCPVKQFLPYENYIAERSPFRTQQGIKGAEFERVIVVLDDEEGTHNQFSYEKYLGLKALSDTDARNDLEGKDSTVKRTRRLFYVSCTRALKDLAVVLFTSDPDTAATKLRASGVFPADQVHTLSQLPN